MNKKTLKKIFIRSWTSGAAFNNLRGQGHGWVYTLYPLFDELYPNPEDSDKKKEAIKRHEVYVNITPQVNTLGIGLVASMEEKLAAGEDIDPASINAIKAAIMGPASGVGDALFQTTVKLIAATASIGLAQSGSPLGGVLFFVIFNAASFFTRRYLLGLSYEQGDKIIEDATKSGIISIITNAAAVLGLFMIGATVASTVSMSFILSWDVVEGGTVTLQSFFDAIMPKFLPLVVTLFIAYLLRKKVDANLLMILIIVLSILCNFLGIL